MTKSHTISLKQTSTSIFSFFLLKTDEIVNKNQKISLKLTSSSIQNIILLKETKNKSYTISLKHTSASISYFFIHKIYEIVNNIHKIS